jgi:hypothetical protein
MTQELETHTEIESSSFHVKEYIKKYMKYISKTVSKNPKNIFKKPNIFLGEYM